MNAQRALPTISIVVPTGQGWPEIERCVHVQAAGQITGMLLGSGNSPLEVGG